MFLIYLMPRFFDCKKSQEMSQPIAHVDMFVDCHDIGKIKFRNWEKIRETSFFEFLGIFLGPQKCWA